MPDVNKLPDCQEMAERLRLPEQLCIEQSALVFNRLAREKAREDVVLVLHLTEQFAKKDGRQGEAKNSIICQI